MLICDTEGLSLPKTRQVFWIISMMLFHLGSSTWSGFFCGCQVGLGSTICHADAVYWKVAVALRCRDTCWPVCGMCLRAFMQRHHTATWWAGRPADQTPSVLPKMPWVSLSLCLPYKITKLVKFTHKKTHLRLLIRIYWLYTLWGEMTFLNMETSKIHVHVFPI